MIRLRTLGSIGLSDAAGVDLAPVLRQPKRLALLVYVALARPRGFHRRDSLVALFWPELDDEHARASLRQSLYTLRRELPDGVLVSRGDAEVGLAADRLWCDVHAFEAAVAAGRDDEALKLYRGELLSGFHFADASPEFGYWLDMERARLRELALDAGRSASARAEKDGDLESASRWAARVAELAPLDEPPVRRQMALLHRRGDRSGAMAAFDAWRRRLEEQLEVQPTPEMLAFAESLRTSAPAGAPESPWTTAPPPPAAPDAEDAGAATVGEAGTRVGKGRGGWLIGSAALLLAVVMGALLLPLRLDWLDGAAATAPPRTIVVPFSYRGGGEAAYLSEGLAYLFTVALDGESLRVADPRSVVRRAKEGGRAEYDRAAAAGLADGFAARMFVLGSAVESQGRLRVSAGLYRSDHAEPVTSATASGTTADVLVLVDQVAGELLTSISERAGSRVTRIASVTTQSLPALKAYLRGERLLGEGRFGEAIEAFEAAVAADTMFALAYYRTSVAASWAFRGELATGAANRAVRHAERLPERERRLLAAYSAYRRGDAAEAADLFRQLTGLYPEDPEIWYRLGEVVMHLGPVRAWPLDEARGLFHRAAQLDPDLTEAYYHLTQIAALAGDTAAALDHAAHALEAAPTGARAPQLLLLQAVLRGSGGRDARLRRLSGADDFTIVSSIYNLSLYLGRPDLARDVARLLVVPGHPLDTRVFGHLLLAELELSLGRRAAATAELDALERLDPRAGAEYRALLALAPAADPDTAALRPLLSRLGSLTQAEPGVMPSAAAPRWKPDARYAPLPLLYARGMLASALGDTAALDAVVRGIARVAEGAEAAELTADFRAVSGVVEWSAAPADPSAGPGAPPAFSAPSEIMVLSPFLSRPARRFAEARRLEREGLAREALRWYESLMAYSTHDLPWAVPALVDRARIHASLGETAAAAALYRRFARLWAEADDSRLRDFALARAERLEADAR